MKEIGGYFELELRKDSEYHSEAISLNSGRTSFQYVLEAKKYKKVYLPFYGCNVLLEPIERLGLMFEYYSTNQDFEVEFNFSKLDSTSCFLYTNYLGLKDNYIKSLAAVCTNLIVDNAQAFYSMPLKGVDTFYSPRKFFGVPDGGYLYTDKLVTRELEKDLSFSKFEHLLKRSDLTAEAGYPEFVDNERRFSNVDIKSMSGLTSNLLKNIDYDAVAWKRKDNFLFLQTNLKDENLLKVKAFPNQVPLSYPFYTSDDNLRKRLIENKIYTPQYWPNVLENTSVDSVEYRFASKMIHLPIDQRLALPDLDRIIAIIKL